MVRDHIRRSHLDLFRDIQVAQEVHSDEEVELGPQNLRPRF